MAKTAFDKIKAGIADAKVYLEILTKKRGGETRPTQQNSAAEA